MTETVAATHPPKLHFGWRIALIALLVAASLSALHVVFQTPLGDKLRDRALVVSWVAVHPISAPLVLVCVYLICSVLMLPVWPVQLASGYCFGWMFGLIWCEIGAAIGGVAALQLSRLLVGEWFRARYESRVVRLHQINENLGNNGLYVVMGIRLCHLLPFGLSNYLFGLTAITATDVFVGTLGGGLPAIGAYVFVGAGLGTNLRAWRALAIVNIVMLLPLGWKYWKSRQIRKQSKL